MTSLPPFTAHLSRELERRAVELAAEWLHELLRVLPEDPLRIFPERTLLDHVPLLIRRIASSLASEDDPAGPEEIREELQMIARLRRSQGYHYDELVSEFRKLAAILFAALEEEAERFEGRVDRAEAIRLARRLHDTLAAFLAVTTTVFRTDAATERAARGTLLSRFSREVTHEIRNRIGAAVLALEVYRRENGATADAKSLLDRARASLLAAEEAVSDVYSVAAAQHAGITTDERVAPLSDVVTRVCEDLAELAADREVRIETVADLPAVPVDAARVQLVLVNLLTNSIKYRDPEKRDRWARISVEKTGVGDEWCIHVGDNGVGIDSDLARRVFETDVRGTDGSGESGEGLGLSIAREAIAQLGGRIWFESKPGDGTRFSFTLAEMPREIESRRS